MRNKNSAIWIEVGYASFAKLGFDALKVEKLSALVEISKSSFYYNFVDMENYVHELIQYHKTRIDLLAQKENECNSIDPELIQLLVAFRWDLLFHKQLRFSGKYDQYKHIIAETDVKSQNNFILLWKRELQLDINDSQLESLFQLALENFYFRLSVDTLEENYLRDYFKYLENIIKNMHLVKFQ